MTGKRGTTLIEAVIAVAVVSIVIITLLQALNVGIYGTLDLNRKVSALNLAKSEMEYINSQPYNASTGDLVKTYGSIFLTTSNISDTINYNISGQVSNVNGNPYLQQIKVNVSYLNGKKVQLTGFKTATTSASSPPSKGQIVTDVIEDMPFLGGGGYGLGCSGNGSCGTYTGYYYVFNTSQSGYISATWNFTWSTMPGAWCNFITSFGAPYIGIYQGEPAWVNNNSQGNYEQDGVIVRPGCLYNNITGGGFGGCMPNGNAGNCSCSIASDSASVVMEPSDCSVNWLDHNWTYELGGGNCTQPPGSYEFSVTTTTPVNASTYTVLFFNGEPILSYQTVSASITYIH